MWTSREAKHLKNDKNAERAKIVKKKLKRVKADKNNRENKGKHKKNKEKILKNLTERGIKKFSFYIVKTVKVTEKKNFFFFSIFVTIFANKPTADFIICFFMGSNYPKSCKLHRISYGIYLPEFN